MTTELKTLRTHESANEAPAVKNVADDVLENVNLEAENEPKRSRIQIIALLIALNLALFIAAVDQTIVATAIPTISAELHSAGGYTWIGSAYLLANAAAGPIWTKISDIWGRKPILLFSVAWFFVTSIICATAPTMTVLIAGRALQGIAGGSLINLSMIVTADLFSMRLRTLFIGVQECVWAVAGGVGPILGGVFAEKASWRWCFWLNLPISGLTFILLFLYLDVHNPRTKAVEGLLAIDYLGSLCILGLTLMLLLGLDFGGVVFPWSSPKVICLIVFGALMSVFFIWTEKKIAKYPLFPLRIFGSPSNMAAFLVTFFHGFVFNAVEFFLPLYFQSVKNASPIQSGLYLLPVTVLEALMGIVGGLVIHRTGRYQELIWIGMILMTLGIGLFINIGADTSLGRILAYEVITGIGAGLVFNPPLIAIQALVAQDDVATATAAQSFLRNLGMSVGLVVGGVIIQNGMSKRAGNLRAAGLSPALLSDFTGGDAAANVDQIGRIGVIGQRHAVQEAFAWSLQQMWIVMVVFTAVGLIASAFITKAVLSKEHVETKTGLAGTSPAEKQEDPSVQQ